MRYTSDIFELAATDLPNYLGCAHLTQLNRKVALNEIKKASWYDPSLEVLIKRGEEHEAAYVEFLSKKGLKVAHLKGKPVQCVVEAMQQGVDVIVQATLANEQWMGYADILLRVAGESKFGNWSYEVQDTKLAKDTRAGTILQLCLYTDLLSILQGTVPGRMHVVMPGDNFPTEEYRFAEFDAYYRLVKKNFETLMAGPAVQSYPYPVERCGICNWWQECDKQRHIDDHLSLVAGIRSLHILELERQNIQTLEQFAKLEKLESPERGNEKTFLRRQLQARIQLEGRIQNKLLHEVLVNEPGRGLNRLPKPNEGDIYFDIEGDAFYDDGGLEYILGYAYKENGILTYEKLWSTNRSEERKAFEKFMLFVWNRWQRFPEMYIYHFAPYEPSAIKRLARVHASCEKEVDELLRAERFIDLHAVFKEALLASVESYSLKALEKFTTYTRNVDLHDASSARKYVEIALELHDFKSLTNKTIEIVEKYNEDDCLATEALHRWLENLRTGLVNSGAAFLRPELKTGAASENLQQEDGRSQALFQSLTKNLPEDRSTWNDEEKAKWLLAHQIDYFRREDKSAWWEHYRVHELEYEDLLEERKAIAGLQFESVLPKEGKERNTTHRYRYPPQEISISIGDEVIAVKGDKIGSVRGISFENNTIDIKKTGNAEDVHVPAIHVSERVDPKLLANALIDFAAQVDLFGLGHDAPFHASKDLLMKRAPMLIDRTEGAHLLPHEDVVQAAVRIALNLNRSVLAIQGPPGSGKTYTGATMIIELAKAGKKIGITAVSHKVIRNLAEACINQGKEQNFTISFAHKVREKSNNPPSQILEVEKSDLARAALKEGKVVCGTAWLWAEDKSRETLDYLFVDEAGQMSLTQVLAASVSAKNIILLGDPQQLEQPQKGSHPEGSNVAALTYLLDGHATIPEGKGLFLGVTRRLHPDICKFTSEIFYEGRLTSLPGLEKQVLTGNTPFDGAGFFYVPVDHRGNGNKSLEEVNTVAAIVDKLLSGAQWTNATGETRLLQKKDILIVAPYNAQVAALVDGLPEMHIGTVDRFQGQEAPVVIYTMTASSIEDAPKGMSFLLNPNRMNVAISRAKSVCILVASPSLLEPECKTIDHIRWANILCTFKERAKTVNLIN